MRPNEAIERHVEPVRAAARRALGTPDGRRVLDALERAFCDGDLAAGDLFQTAVRAARHDVIQYLRDLAEEKDGEP